MINRIATFKEYPGMGRGVMSLRNIEPGELIESCPIILLSEADTIKVNQTCLKFYTFKFDDKTDCLVMGLGEIFNHSGEPSARYELDAEFGVMNFYATRNIIKGDQIFTDYRQDDESIDLEAYGIPVEKVS